MGEKHPHKKAAYMDVHIHTQTLRQQMEQSEIYQVHHIWECEWKQQKKELMEQGHVFPPSKVFDFMSDRDIFFGGRVEVFRILSVADESKGEQIKYINVTSRYPDICAFYPLCTGHSARLYGPKIEMERVHPLHPNRYFGYFRGIIQPNTHDRYGGMPKKNEHGSLEFSNHRGEYCGFLDELYERIEHGATVVELYEILHFDETQRIIGPSKGTWLTAIATSRSAPGEKVSLATHRLKTSSTLTRRWLAGMRWRKTIISACLGGTVCKNRPVEGVWQISIATVCEASMSRRRGCYGKFESRPCRSTFPSATACSSTNDQCKWKDLPSTFLILHLATLMCSPSAAPMSTGASVTAWTRLILQKMNRHVDAIYCDTDSVVDKRVPGVTPDLSAFMGQGIDQWGDELGGNGNYITEFIGLGPKVYAYKTKLPDGNGNFVTFKTKGVPLNITNPCNFKWDTLLGQLFTNYTLETDLASDEDPNEGALMVFDNLALEIHGKTLVDGKGSRSILRESKSRLLRPTFNKRCPIKFASYSSSVYQPPRHLWDMYRAKELANLYFRTATLILSDINPTVFVEDYGHDKMLQLAQKWYGVDKMYNPSHNGDWYAKLHKQDGVSVFVHDKRSAEEGLLDSSERTVRRICRRERMHAS